MGKSRWNIALVMMIAALLFSYPHETKTVNGYKVIKGERPSIDLSKVQPDAYYPGKIWIKLAPEMEKFISVDQVFTKTKDGFLMKTGIESIDRLNEKYSADQFRPKLYGFYEISPASKQYRERHKAWGFHLWVEVKLPENANIIQAVKEYMALPEVEFAEPVYKDALFEPVYKETYDPEIHGPLNGSDPKLTVNDTRFAEQWHYHNTGQQSGTVDCDIDLPEAWDIERGNNQVIVAVQDMGLQINHPDLAGNIWSGIGYDFQANNSTIEAGDHGCHTGGTISAVTNNNTGVSGIAGGSGSGDGVRLMSVQVYAPDGTGGGNTNLPYIYSADNGAAISQNSWGYTTVGSYSQSVLDGIDYFNANGGGSVLGGGLTIFAAGNSNASGLWYPGCYSGAMAVAATNNKDIRSYYSNYDTWVEVSAPGGETNSVTARGVLSCISGSTYAFYQGTSMACPHTSGVAALIISLAPGVFTNTEVRNIIKSTTDPIDALNPTYAGKLGTGRVNAYKALIEAQDQMSGVLNPKTFSSTAASTSQINLAWTKNDANNGVMIISNTTGTFGIPNNGTSYSVGNTIPGGGTVIYKNTGTTYSHTGLNANTAYYYKAFSYTNQNEYSSGKTASTTTLMNPLPPSAASMGFENGGSIPNGWSQDGGWTFVTTASRPTGPAEGSYFAFYNAATGSTSKLVTPRFDMTGYTNVTLNFQYVVTYLKSGPSNLYDKIRIYYKNSSAGSWVQIGSELSGNLTTWQAATTINISDAVLSNDFYIAFEGIDAGAYGVSVDDVVINGSQAAPPAAPSLVSPASGTNTTNKRPAFDWSDSSGATSYTIQVDNNSNFSSPEIQQSPAVSNYTPTTDLADGAYYWRVLATNAFGSSTYTSAWTINIGSAPAVPVLVSPANTSTTTNLRPAFDWGDVTGATSYTIQVDNNSDFSSPEISQSPAASNYTPASDLTYGTYYWRVLATNSFGSSAYSSSWSIVIQAPPPSAPSLVSPTNASNTYDRRPAFDWSDVAEATTYTILVDNNSDFSSPEINQAPAVSNYTPASDLPYGTYYWKVRSNNANGSSDYTSAWSLNIQELLIPNITLSVANISETAAVNDNVQNSFSIGNTGNADINYNISTSYSLKKSYINVSESYFTSDLNNWVNSGQRTWAQTVSANNLDGSPYISVTGQLSQSRTAILTSPQFDGTVCSVLYLDFDHVTTLTNASVFNVQYSVNGIDYTTVYSTSAAVGSWGNPDHQSIELPQISATMTIRLSATLGSTSTWSADNIVVSGPEVSNFSWLIINSPVSGTVTPAGSNTVNYACDATGLEPGTYYADITVTSNDPDEPEKIIPVEFVVYQPIVVPGVPLNVVTSVVGTDIQIDWDAAADATSYDVYASDDPYGTFTFVTSVPTNQYVTPYTDAKKFWYIVSKNATK